MKTVTLEEISQRVAPNQAQQAQKVLDLALRVIQSELSAGNQVQLPYRVVVSIGNDALIAPAAAPGAAMPAAASRVEAPPTITPGPDAYQIYLAVPENDFFAAAIARRLTGPKSQVSVLEGREKAMASVQKTVPHLLVIDANMPDSSELIRDVKANRETSLVATIMIYSEGSDPEQVDGLKVCHDEHIIEPFELNDLVRLTEGELARSIEEGNFFQHEIHFQFQTMEKCIEQANEMVTGFLQQVPDMAEENAAAMSVAFREAVDNAARHGNKSQERRVIDAIYLLDREKVTITVEDEGDGFDTELYIRRGKDGNAVAAARQRNQEGRAGGLGIMLMLKCVDDLQYNYAGNQIRLTKYVRS